MKKHKKPMRDIDMVYCVSMLSCVISKEYHTCWYRLINHPEYHKCGSCKLEWTNEAQDIC